jgi:uncharacterized protein YqgC (DUF456 family)
MTLLLILIAVVSLPLTAVGLPGNWILIAAVGLWKSFDESASVSWTAILIAFALALVAELIEFGLASRYTSKYGGSKRAGWGALIGGIAGAIVGVPVPVIGSIIGSFTGAFLGALVAEYSVHQRHDDAGRVAWGALVGRVIATGVKVGIGVMIAVILVGSAVM